ncbi:MAG TPA: EAL domain-containing protein [Gaiellaceae bacterium]|nr:EAL domain-containing protein [Gaiellaceae bacterium]
MKPGAAIPSISNSRLARGGRRLFSRCGNEGLTVGLRLVSAFAATLLVVGAIGFVLMGRALAQDQIRNYARTQAADVRSFEAYGAKATSPAAANRKIDAWMDTISRRPGTLEVLLIDSHHVVRAAADDRLIGTTDSDSRVEAALEQDRSYAGHEGNPKLDRRNFEFVLPVDLPGGRYAYEVTYDHRTFDAQLASLQKILALIGLVALFAGAVVFYLVGGRSLLRDHQLALERATRDGLTDLPNQRAFHDEFDAAVTSALRYRGGLALAVFDIDDFKFLNDRHGHPHGDHILKRVAGVLRDGRPSDRAYRIGGDEFAVLLPQTDAEGARVLAQRLTTGMTEAGIQVSLGLSTLRPGQSADALRAEADAALYEVKRRGGGRIVHFDEIRDRVTITGSDRRQAVRRLIEEGGMTTVFQPIWDITENRLIGVEALSRPAASYGFGGPAEAFDIAEQLGLVHELDVLCVRKALDAVQGLPPGVLLFVNLCPQTLDIDAGENDWLRQQVEPSSLTPDQVVVEITERFGGRTSSVVKSLEQLREQGFKLALDDVGTGNSGLEILRKMHPEFVKLDGSIVTAAETDPTARAVLLAIASFAHQTDGFVIAEGIENDATLEFLGTLDSSDVWPGIVIRGGQGFHLGVPGPGFPPSEQSALGTSPLLAA